MLNIIFILLSVYVKIQFTTPTHVLTIVFVLLSVYYAYQIFGMPKYVRICILISVHHIDKTWCLITYVCLSLSIYFQNLFVVVITLK